MPDIFKKFQGKEIRTFVDLNTKELWFVAKDVANILGYERKHSSTKKLVPNTTNMLKHIPVEYRKVLNRKTVPKTWGQFFSSRNSLILINETGLYLATFKSTKQNAKDFMIWISETVLPSIRKNGFYISPESLVNPSKKLIKISGSIMQTRQATIQKREGLLSRIEKFLDSETGYKENSLNRVVSTVYQHLHIATSLKTAVLIIQDNLLNSETDGLKINSYNPKQEKSYDKDYLVAVNYYTEKQLQLFDSYFLSILEDIMKHLNSPHTKSTSKSVINILKNSGIRQIQLVTDLDLGTTFQGKIRSEVDELVYKYKKGNLKYLEMAEKLHKLRAGKSFKI